MNRIACLVLAAVLLAATQARAGGAEADRYPSDEALRHYLAGRWFEETGDLASAGAELARAAALDPASPGVLLRACDVALRTGESSRALELSRRVLELSPGEGRALWLQGAALYSLSRPQEALSPLMQAVAADSTNPECIRTLAHVAEALDRVALLDSCYERIVDLDPEDAESWFQLATTRARLGRFAEADSALSIAMADSPTRPGALFLRGWLRERLGHPEEAIALYEQHLQVHSADLATRRRLVVLLVQQGRDREALEQARRISEAQPGDASALLALADLEYRTGQVGAGSRSLQRMRALAPGQSDLAARSAEVLLRNERGPDAVRFIDGWVAEHPGAGNDLRMKSWVRAASGRLDSAVAYARLEVAQNPDSIPAARALARYLREAHRWTEAADELGKLSARAPGDPSLLLDLSLCLEQAGDVTGAIAAGRDALALAPDSPQTLNFLGYLLADHAQDLAAAEKMIRRAVEQDPDNGAYLDSMGWVLFRLGDFAAARGPLERAIALTGEDPVVHEHLGDVYRELKLLDLARAQYQLSLAADSANSRVRNKLEAVH